MCSAKRKGKSENCREGGGYHSHSASPFESCVEINIDLCDDESIAFPPRRAPCAKPVVQECCPPRLAIGQRLPLEDVNSLAARFSDKGRPKADRMDTVFFLDGSKRIPKPNLQLCDLARSSLIHPQFVNH